MSNPNLFLPSILLIAASSVAQDTISLLPGSDDPVTDNSATNRPFTIHGRDADHRHRIVLDRPATAVATGWATETGAPRRDPDLGSAPLPLEVPELPPGTMQDPPPAPTTAWKGSVNLGAYLFDGNTERRGANLGAKAERRSEHERTTATFSWDYAEDREPMIAGWSLRQRRVDGSLQEDYFLTKKTYLFVTTSATGDWRADLDLRFTVGAGVGHQWADEKDFSFKTEVGLSYVREDFRSGAPTNEYLAARLAYGLEWQISKSTRLLQDVEALPSIEDASDITLTKSTRLQVSLSESMVSEFKWELDYDNTPSPGLERVDNRFFITLGWNF